MMDWSWNPPSGTRAAIRRGDAQYRDYQRRISEQVAAARRVRREQVPPRAIPPEMTEANA